MKSRELNRHLSAWLTSGLIDSDQAEAIRSSNVQAEEHAARKTRIAEVLGFAGGALVVGAVIVLMTEHWTTLGIAGRVGIPAAVAVLGIIAGLLLGRAEGTGAARLSEFLLAVGVVGAAGAFGLGMLEFARAMGTEIAQVGSEGMAEFAPRHWTLWGSTDSEWAWFAAATGAALVGGPIWWFRRSVLQHLAFGLGVGCAALLLLPLLPFGGPDWGAGLVLVCVGLAWGAASLAGWLEPHMASLSLGTLGVLGGFQIMTLGEDVGPSHWPLWLGLAAAIAFIVASIPLKKSVFLGLGAAGVVMYVWSIIEVVFKGAIGGPLAMLIVGLVFVGMAVLVGVMVPRFEARGQRDTKPTGAMPAGV